MSLKEIINKIKENEKLFIKGERKFLHPTDAIKTLILFIPKKLIKK